MNSIYHDGNKNIGGAALGFTTWVFSVGIMSVFIIPGIIYMHGVGAAWFGIALALGIFVSWASTSYRMMLYATKEKGVCVISDYVDERYRKKTVSGWIMRIIISLFAVGIIAYMLSFLKNMLHAFAPGREILIIVIMLAIIYIFTVLFGLSGIAYMSVIKGVCIFVAMILMVVTIWMTLGKHGILKGLFSSRPDGGMTSFLNALDVDGRGVSGVYLISELSWIFIILGIPNIANLFLTYGNTRDLSKGRTISISFSVIVLFTSAVLGVFLRAYLADSIYLLGDMSVIEVFVRTFEKLGDGNNLGGWARIMYVAAIFIAASSVIDTSLHLSTSVLSTVGHKSHNGRKKRTGDYMRISVISAFIILASVLLGLYIDSSDMSILKFLLMETGCILAPGILASLLDKRSTDMGVAMGMIMGGLVSAVWNFAPFITSGKNAISLYEYTELSGILPSTVAAYLVIFLVSRITRDVDDKVKDEFDEVRKHIVV